MSPMLADGTFIMWHAWPIESFGKVAGGVCLGNQLGEVRIMRRAGIEIVCSELLPASSVTRAFPNRATAEWVEDCRGARQTQVSAVVAGS
jgi:hypothetical protein